jgi:hypothetical protein
MWRGAYATLSVISEGGLTEAALRRLQSLRVGESQMPGFTIEQTSLHTWVVDLERRRVWRNRMPTSNRYPEAAIKRRLKLLTPVP